MLLPQIEPGGAVWSEKNRKKEKKHGLEDKRNRYVNFRVSRESPVGRPSKIQSISRVQFLNIIPLRFVTVDDNKVHPPHIHTRTPGSCQRQWQMAGVTVVSPLEIMVVPIIDDPWPVLLDSAFREQMLVLRVRVWLPLAWISSVA